MLKRNPTLDVDNEFDYPADTLGMDPQEMRRLGHKVVDLVVDRLLRKNAEPALIAGGPTELMQALGGALPETPMDPDQSLELLAEVALAYQQHGDHPRYFARVPGPCSFAAVLGEWMGTGFNTISASWGGGSGPATIELVVIEWLRQMIGMPEGTEGVLLSGGSIANVTAFLAARSELGRGVAYFCDQTHSSLYRDLLAMGCIDEHMHKLPSDENYCMSIDALRAAVASDKAAGLRPVMVVATAGTTNTGAADPLHAIADLCTQEDMWFHVDGAYGGPAAVTAQGRRHLDGMERADSVVLDPHKWFFQPYDLGICMVTRPGALERCYAMSPEYLKDVQATTGAVNFGNRSLELTRRSRAVKLWMSLRTYGAERFREAVQRGIELAEFAERYLRQNPATWEVVTPAQIGVVCFALRDWQEGEHAACAKTITDSGFACVSSTMLRDKSVLRLCTINPLTTEDDIVKTIDRLAAARP
ncbi:MAG: aminotransferase class I/II-fold pyridoxal phosphate-dependent enzyme [Gammaproteobacteria bacterium]|jgi:glutamate/tyrosine decarboxylase-like PLP-dependent enzyme|nr:aminotransferase class I/II-fold pyridoxal phosphate-dependent enzyme [Gammaproteobacteria bacterium]